MVVATVDGVDYVVVSSAQGNSGALSVMSVLPNGALSIIDHVGDIRDTRFASAQTVDALEVDGPAGPRL